MATIENDKGALLEALLLAAPPGEVNDVFQGGLLSPCLYIDLCSRPLFKKT